MLLASPPSWGPQATWPEVQGIYTLADAGRQITGYTSAVDIWAVGALAFQMVADQRLFATFQHLFAYVVLNTPLQFKRPVEQSERS